MTRTFRIPAGRRRVAVGAVVLLVVVLAVALVVRLTDGGSGAASGRNGDGPLAGKPLPAVVVKRFDTAGTEVHLTDLARGKPMLINVWSSTCEPCKREMPAIDSVYRHANGKVVFVGVNVSDTAETGQRFYQRYGATYTQVRDPRATLVTEVGSQVLPTTLLVDAKGNIVDGHLGALTASQVRKLLADDFGVHVDG